MRNFILAYVLKNSIVIIIGFSLFLLDLKIIDSKQMREDAALVSQTKNETRRKLINNSTSTLIVENTVNKPADNKANKFNSETTTQVQSTKKIHRNKLYLKVKNRTKDSTTSKTRKKESVRDKLHSFFFTAHTLILIKTGAYSQLPSDPNEDHDLRKNLPNSIKNVDFSQQKYKTKIGGGVEKYVSGNSLGVLYSPYLSLSRGNNMLSIGPVIQKRSMLLSGFKAGYSRIIIQSDMDKYDCDGDYVDQRLQLNFFGYVQYVHQMPMSYRSIILEETMNKPIDYDWNKLKLNTAEMCLGFELHIKLAKNISWKNYFGISVYDHLNYKKEMYHDKISPTLILGTGINITSFRK